MAIEAELKLRRRVPEDDAFVARLGDAAFSDFSRHSGTHTLEMVRCPRAITWLAMRGTEPVGFAVLEFGPRGVAFLQAIAVIERERGRGVGRRLLAAIERCAREHRARSLQLCTAEANVAALDLFLKQGFQIQRRMPRYYGRGENACEMVKQLEMSAHL